MLSLVDFNVDSYYLNLGFTLDEIIINIPTYSSDAQINRGLNINNHEIQISNGKIELYYTLNWKRS